MIVVMTNKLANACETTFLMTVSWVRIPLVSIMWVEAVAQLVEHERFTNSCRQHLDISVNADETTLDSVRVRFKSSPSIAIALLVAQLVRAADYVSSIFVTETELSW